MRVLYHYPLGAFSRVARIYLAEKGLPHDLEVEYPWDRKKIFSEPNVPAEIPALTEKNGLILEGWYPIIEYLEQVYRQNSMLGESAKSRAESRKIASIFNVMFFSDVTKAIVFEKIFKRHTKSKSPDSSAIRRGSAEIGRYFEYITWLVERRNWLAGDEFSIADISAAAHISCVDYVGSIDWDNYPSVKDWYTRIKSRPSFRDILQDRISDLAPPEHYSELDF